METRQKIRGLEPSTCSLSLRPATDSAREPTWRSGAGSVSLQLPSFPDIIEHVRRSSTRDVVREALLILRGKPSRTGQLNVRLLASRTGYSRRTVARALSFAVAVNILERVDWAKYGANNPGRQPGRPARYRSLWKPTTSKRAPSPHTPLQRHTRERAKSLLHQREFTEDELIGVENGRIDRLRAAANPARYTDPDQATTTPNLTSNDGNTEQDPILALRNQLLIKTVANFLNYVISHNHIQRLMDGVPRNRRSHRGRTTYVSPWASSLTRRIGRLTTDGGPPTSDRTLGLSPPARKPGGLDRLTPTGPSLNPADPDVDQEGGRSMTDGREPRLARTPAVDPVFAGLATGHVAQGAATSSTLTFVAAKTHHRPRPPLRCPAVKPLAGPRWPLALAGRHAERASLGSQTDQA